MRASTIARNYAEALLVLARKAGDLEGWGRALDGVVHAVESDTRLRNFLTERAWLDDRDHDRMAAEIEAEVRAVVAEQEKLGPPSIDTLIEDVFETPSWLQLEQFRELQGD